MGGCLERLKGSVVVSAVLADSGSGAIRLEVADCSRAKGAITAS